MTAPTYIRVWVKVKHGKTSKSEQLIAGEIPKAGGRTNLPRKLHFEVKRKVREEFLKTGRIVSAERVEGIIATIKLASCLE